MRFHMYVSTRHGWVNADTQMLRQFNATKDSIRAELLRYEHCYDAAREHAQANAEIVELRDEWSGCCCVRFDRSGNVSPRIYYVYTARSFDPVDHQLLYKVVTTDRMTTHGNHLSCVHSEIAGPFCDPHDAEQESRTRVNHLLALGARVVTRQRFGSIDEGRDMETSRPISEPNPHASDYVDEEPMPISREDETREVNAGLR